MKIRTITWMFSALALASAIPAFGSSCDSLAKLALKDTAVTMAQEVPAGQFSAPGGRGANPYKDLPEFCRVAATIKPSVDSDIKVEVWLPANGWNVPPDIMKSGEKDKRENRELVARPPPAFASFLGPRQQCLNLGTGVRDHSLPRRSAVLPETSALAGEYGI